MLFTLRAHKYYPDPFTEPHDDFQRAILVKI